MIQLRRRITPGIIRPICLPDPGEIIRSHINDKVWFNSRSFTMHSTKIVSHDTCVEHREYALQEYPYSITLKRFASIIHSELCVIKCTEIEIRPGDIPCCSAGKITWANFYLCTFYDAQLTVSNSSSTSM